MKPPATFIKRFRSKPIYSSLRNNLIVSRCSLSLVTSLNMDAGNKICTWQNELGGNKTCIIGESCKTEEKVELNDFGQHKHVLHAKYGSDHIHLQNLKAIEIESLKYIGFGTFSTVKKGYSKIYKDDIAVKIILLRDKSNSSVHKKYLRREIKLWKELSIHKHKNILSLKDLIKTNKYLYIVTDLVERGNLHSFLLRVSINESTGRSIFHNIVDAVCYCHGKKIAHRDIKPENILMGKGETIKLAGNFILILVTIYICEHI